MQWVELQLRVQLSNMHVMLLLLYLTSTVLLFNNHSTPRREELGSMGKCPILLTNTFFYKCFIRSLYSGYGWQYKKKFIKKVLQGMLNTFYILSENFLRKGGWPTPFKVCWFCQQPLKLTIPIAHLFIQFIICSLVFYSHINAISSLYSRNLIVQNLIFVY